MNKYNQNLDKKQVRTYQYLNNKLKTLKIRIDLSVSSILLHNFKFFQKKYQTFYFGFHSITESHFVYKFTKTNLANITQPQSDYSHQLYHVGYFTVLRKGKSCVQSLAVNGSNFAVAKYKQTLCTGIGRIPAVT